MKKLLLPLLTISVIIGLVILVFGKEGHTDRQPLPKAFYIEHTICSGDTIWSIAKTHTPANRSISAFSSEIMELNNKKNSQVLPGEKLIIPIYQTPAYQ